MGVALWLLSPSASPEKVWLYAAELDGHSLAAAHSDLYPVAVRQHAQSAHSLVSWSPEYTSSAFTRPATEQEPTVPVIPGTPCRAPKNAPIGKGAAKPARGNAKRRNKSTDPAVPNIR
jgi:hypothetical protein